MSIVIVPGVHPPSLTAEFLAAMELDPAAVAVFPTTPHPPYDAGAVRAFWQDRLGPPTQAPPLLGIAFSAGTVGAIAAAQHWQQAGGRVAALIALDGWGMPAWTSFPVYRLSHDGFTHWSSRLLGGAPEGFYADPPVAHLTLWRSPHTTSGWAERTPIPGFPPSTQYRTTAAAIMHHWLANHRT